MKEPAHFRRGAKKAGGVCFITGTDTGVGKTLLTALLLHHLRLAGCAALAMKPFCSGGRGDVELLQSLQPGELSDDEANPFYFDEPVAPLAARRKSRKKISLTDVLKRIEAVQKKCDFLLIEGSGGLLVPLEKDLMVSDLVIGLANRSALGKFQNCRFRVLVVAVNRLGTINHTLLTVRHLQASGIKDVTVVLMGVKKPDISVRDNAKILTSWLTPVKVMEAPFLGREASSEGGIKKSHKIVKKTLAQICVAGNLALFF